MKHFNFEHEIMKVELQNEISQNAYENSSNCISELCKIFEYVENV